MTSTAEDVATRHLADIPSVDVEMSAHELLRSYDCRTPGCMGEARAAEGDDAYCRPCQTRSRAHANGDTAAVSEPQADVEGAPAKPSFECKTEGCETRVGASWGKWSYCRDCQVKRGTSRPVKAPRQRQRVAKLPADKPAPAADAPLTPIGFEARALELVDAGRALDEALARWDAAREALAV